MDLDDEETRATREMNNNELKKAQREIIELRNEIYTLEDDIGKLIEHELELATEIHVLKLKNLELQKCRRKEQWG